MAKFKNGDRVILIIGQWGLNKNIGGTIQENDNIPYVLWDNGQIFAIDEDDMKLDLDSPNYEIY